eukprot:m.55891 g.55891  ORF g.55891 m.55891 type:complete len:111 (+) comp13669_c0_seq1:1277-1609(+)
MCATWQRKAGSLDLVKYSRISGGVSLERRWPGADSYVTSVSKLEQWSEQTTQANFTWLIAESQDQQMYSSTHTTIATFPAFESIQVSKTWPFVSVKMRSTLVAMMLAKSN